MGFDLNDIKVEVLKKMKADPRRVSGIDLTFFIPDSLKNIDEKTMELLKDIGINCPVMKSIHPDIEVNVDWGGWS